MNKILSLALSSLVILIANLAHANQINITMGILFSNAANDEDNIG